MKKILIPTDFSDCATAATEVALKIAKKAGASVSFLHMFVTPVDWVKLNLQQEKVYPGIRKKIAHAKSELHKWEARAKNFGVENESILAHTQVEKSILEYAQDHESDLIIMGSQGASGLKEIVLGSKAQFIVSKAHTPVLVIKEDIKELDIQEILFASTFQEDILEPFSKIIEFAHLFSAHVQLLFINSPEYFEETHQTEKRMEAFAEKCPQITCDINIYNAKHIEEGIIWFAENHDIDVIALITHGRKGFKGMFIESLTEKVVNHSNLPVLSVNLES